MVVARDHFLITNDLYNNLFDDTLYVDKQKKIVFKTGFENGGWPAYLNYYNFNILLNITRYQNTIYHSLDDKFFNDLSTHKKKLIFYGFVNDNRTIFTLTKLIYLCPSKKMGIFVRKKLLSQFQAYELNLLLDKNQTNAEVTLFTLQ